MDLIIERADVWAANIQDTPGGLANLLAGLKDAGADLDFVLARRTPENPGVGVVFVTPLRGDAEVSAAASLGFNVTSSVHSVRIEGENKRGIAAELTDKIAKAGINLRGFSASVSGTRFVIFIGFNCAEDAKLAVDILSK